MFRVSQIPESDRIVLVFSDVEMGSGGPEDDFPHTAFLGELLDRYLEPPYRDRRIDVVFAGDTFDLLKTPYLDQFPHHITADVALGKMSRVAAAHPRFFEALRHLTAPRDPPVHVHFIVGNHDGELLFPQVQDFVRALGGGSDRIRFPGLELDLGPVRCEHGHQADPLFAQDPAKPFVEYEGRPLLNVAWASIALLDAVIPLRSRFAFYERLVPRNRVMELVPELKELVMARLWKYWSRDFWRDFVATKDPLLKLNWTMVKEVFRRFTTASPEVAFQPDWLEKKVRDHPAELVVVGHLHQVSSRYHGSTRLLQSGCFRDEYLLSEDGESFTPRLKPYYEIHIHRDRISGLLAREIPGPARPAEEIPPSVFPARELAAEVLAEMGDRSKEEARRKRTEARES